MAREKILIVEDEFITGADIQNSLKKMGYQAPLVIDNGEDAIRKTGELHPDLVLMDITLIGKMTGIEAADRIRELYDIPVIFLTAHSDDVTIAHALESEPFGYIIKPFEERNLKTTIQMALYKHAIDAKLRESTEIIETLLNTTTDIIILLDHEGNVLAMNESMVNQFHKKEHEPSSLTINDFLASGIVTPRMAEEELRVRSGKPSYFVEHVGASWYENTLLPIRNSYGTVTKIAIYSHDITAMKEWELKMEEMNAQLLREKQEILKFSTALDNMDDSVVITDGTGIIQYVNTSFQKKFGYSVDEIRGRHFSDLRAPENRLPVSREVFIESSKDVWNGTFIAKNKFGIRLTTGLKSTPIIRDRSAVNRVFVLREQLG